MPWIVAPDASCCPAILVILLPMNKAAIIQSLDEQVERLKQARQLLGGHDGLFPMVNNGRRKRRHMSAESRALIAAAQRKRWAKVKAQAKKK